MSMEMRLNPMRPDWSNPHLLRYRRAQLLFEAASLSEVEMRCKGVLCYLASPYSKNVAVRDEGWDGHKSLAMSDQAALWQRSFALSGISMISPVVQGVNMVHAEFGQWLDPLNDRFWAQWRKPLLRACGAVVIPPIEGWQESVGVWQDALIALRSNCPVYQIRLNDVPLLERSEDEVVI